MRRDHKLPAALAIVAVALTLGAGSSAFNATTSSTRSSSASVVGTGSAYDGIGTGVMSASTVLGYTAQSGINVTNGGKVATTFTFTKTSDPSAVVTSVTQCAANTAVGSVCAVKFTGPSGLLPGTYTFTGTIDGTGSKFRSTVPSITVTVKYCALPPC
ncbi:MAG: hypothetical protein LC624_10695 [Halobacteriales archaeon]|nr:hypothetical protein [Halobacteriales archaeon]